MTIRILIADDHAVVAEGLRSLIEAQSDMEVIGVAGNGRDTVRQAFEKKPNVVVMDNTMPELNGIEATRIIRERCAGTRIVMLSMHSANILVRRALQAGASAYVMKESAGEELVDAIRTVHAGRRYLSEPLTEDMLGIATSGFPEDPLSRLSSRERQVLQMLAESNSIEDIADKLALSRKTVETYRNRMMKKLGLNDFASLIKFAIQHDVATLD